MGRILPARLGRFNALPPQGTLFRRSPMAVMDTAANPNTQTTIVLVGLMGAGKSSVGRCLAASLGRPFVDADAEIEAEAGQTISEIFASHGEAYFRRLERRVIGRLLAERGQVLATGGGAFMDPETRALIAAGAVSVWLRAEIDILLERVMRRDNRPLLKQGDPRDILSRLIEERYPVYAEADITVDSTDGPHTVVVEDIIRALEEVT
jgi:shikimate kinase